MHFALRGIETRSDHVKLRSLRNPDAPAQIILLDKRPITYGLKVFFVCPRCQSRRAILYFDGLQAYCRACAGLRFASQRQWWRTRLKLKAKKLRAALGDDHGKPDSPFPPRQFVKSRKVYQRKIAALASIEHQLLCNPHHPQSQHHEYRERDKQGRYLARNAELGDEQN